MVQNANTMLTQSSIIDAEDFVGHRLVGFRRLYNLTKLDPSLKGGADWFNRIKRALANGIMGRTKSGAGVDAQHTAMNPEEKEKRETLINDYSLKSRKKLEKNAGLTRLANDWNNKNKKIAEQQAAIKEKDNEIKAKTEDITAKEAEIVNIKNELKELNAKAANLLGMNKMHKEKIEKLNKTVEGMTNDLETTRRDLEDYKILYTNMSNMVKAFEESQTSNAEDDGKDSPKPDISEVDPAGSDTDAKPSPPINDEDDGEDSRKKLISEVDPAGSDTDAK